MPWEVAWNMPDEIRGGWLIAYGNQQRDKEHQFDWFTFSFPEY